MRRLTALLVIKFTTDVITFVSALDQALYVRGNLVCVVAEQVTKTPQIAMTGS